MSTAVIRRRTICAAIGSFAVVCTSFTVVTAEEKLSDGIYREANRTSAVQQPVTPSAQQGAPAATAAPAGGLPFDLTAKQGEHPLMPVLRTVKASQDEIETKVRDYSCVLTKQERVDGELGEKQQIMLKVMHQPFSVYMSFLQPYAGREVVYVAGQNEGKLVVLEAGFKRMLGKMNLDPQGGLAMKGQKHPITDVGIRNLCAKLGKMWEGETKFAESEVTTDCNQKIAGRPCTMLQVVHPKPRQEFRFHAARLFVDNELKIPVHFDAYLWPENPKEEPPLDESYTYTNVKLNNGFTAREFDAQNNPEIFK